MADRAEIDVLAAFVHGAAGALNLLGFFYNLRRSRRIDVDATIHAAALTYHIVCAVKHYNRAESFL